PARGAVMRGRAAGEEPGRRSWAGGAMSVSDPIADFLTGVRNAVRAKRRKVDVPATKYKTEIARVLLRERYINNFKVIEDSKQGVLRLYLKYTADDQS